MSNQQMQKETVAPMHELTIELQDRIRRASAPTLLDLEAVTMELPQNLFRIASIEQAETKSRPFSDDSLVKNLSGG